MIRVLDAGTLTALRSIATVAVLIPTMSVRVQSRGTDVIVVQATSAAVLWSAPPVVFQPRSFRLVVGAAYANHRSGEPAELPGIPCAPPVRIDVTLAEGDAMLPGDIYRWRLENRMWQAFTTTLDQPATRRAVTEGASVLRGAAPPTGFVDIQLQHDPVTAITVGHAAAAQADSQTTEWITESLQALVRRCRVHELVAELDES